MARWLFPLLYSGIAALTLLTATRVAMGSSLNLGTAHAAYSLQQAGAPFEEEIGDATRGMVKGVRRLFRVAVVTFRRALASWTKYARRAARFVLLAAIVGLADKNLITAWRLDGLRVLATYVPLMLYVYVRMLFDRRVPVLPKLLLVAAIAYGVLRRDLIPDRSLFPGMVEDVIFVTVAMRLLLRRCTDEVAESLALEAVNLRRRVLALQRARERESR